MPQPPISLLVVLIVLVGGCSPTNPAAASPAASVSPSEPATTWPSTSQGARPALPPGFPILPGAVAVSLPAGDPGSIALWETDRPGSAAYDFYLAALPAAGYPIVGSYPGGGVALIRFATPGGAVWQMVAQGAADGQVAIEIRVDRP